MTLRSSDTGFREEVKLAKGLKSGRRSVLNQFYDLYAEPIFRFVISGSGGYVALSEEITRDVIVSAVDSIEAYDHRRVNLWDWLCDIAQSKVHEALLEKTRDDQLQIRLHNETAQEPVMYMAEDTDAIRILAKLNPFHQEVLNLKYLKLKSGREIADMLSLSNQEVELRLNQAREEFLESHDDFSREASPEAAIEFDFKCLKDHALPELPPDFYRDIEKKASPIMQSRRKMHHVVLPIAVVIIVVCLGYIWMTSPEAVTPRQKTVDPSPVQQVAEPPEVTDDGFNNKTMAELLALRKKMGVKSRSFESNSRTPIQVILESSDYVVQAVISEIVVDRELLIRDLKEKNARPLYMTAKLDVVKSYPEIGESTIYVSGVAELNEIKTGNSFIMLLKNSGGLLHPLNYASFHYGVYPIIEKGGETIVEIISAKEDAMSLDDSWVLLENLYGNIHAENQSGNSLIPESRLDTLKNGTIAEAATTLETLLAFGYKDFLSADDFADIVINQYELLTAEYEPEGNSEGPISASDIRDDVSDYQKFALRILRLLTPVVSGKVLDEVIELYVDDLSNANLRVFETSDISAEVLKLALSVTDFERPQRVLSLLGKAVEYSGGNQSKSEGKVYVEPGYINLRTLALTQGEDLDNILADMLENPDYMELYWSGDIDFWEKARMEIPELRNEMLENKSITEYIKPAKKVDRLIAEYRNGLMWFSQHHKHAIQPGDLTVQSILRDLPVNDVADVIWLKSPASAYVPALLESLNSQQFNLYGRPYPPVFEALHSCGEPESAMRLAQEMLNSPLDDEDLDSLETDIEKRCGALRYLGRVGDSTVVPYIESLLRDEMYSKHNEVHERIFKQGKNGGEAGYSDYRSPEKRPLAIKIRTAALLALTKLRSPGVIEEWQKEYNGISVPRRIIAAVALYDLGEDTGMEFLEAFESNTIENVPELARHLYVQGWTGEFQETVQYLRSPEIDALYLEHLRNGINPPDRDLLSDDISFIQDYAGDVLPLLVFHLESNERHCRENANMCLETILGNNVDWNTMALARTQYEKVDRWSLEVDAFLSEWRGPLSDYIR